MRLQSVYLIKHDHQELLIILLMLIYTFYQILATIQFELAGTAGMLSLIASRVFACIQEVHYN